MGASRVEVEHGELRAVTFDGPVPAWLVRQSAGEKAAVVYQVATEIDEIETKLRQTGEDNADADAVVYHSSGM